MTLVANEQGVIRGKFTIPENVPAGSKRVAFIGAAHTAETAFVGEGTLTVDTLRQVNTVTTSFYDPVGQSFALERDEPVCGVDLYFCAKGDNPNVRVQLRGMENGNITRTILAEAQVPDEAIVITGGGHTRVIFPTLFYVMANTEYAIVVLCDDPVTSLYVAELGKFDQFKQQAVTSQPYTIGVFYSSSNGSHFTAHHDKDLAFRLLGAEFLTTKKEVDLGSAQITDATDIMLFSLAETPTSATRVEYAMTLPDGNTVTVAEGQPVQMSKKTSGNVTIKASLMGTTAASPILWPGSQLVSGEVTTSADYVTRATIAYGGSRVQVIYDAYIPSGANVTPYSRQNQGDWQALTLQGTTVGDEGFYEYRYELAGIDADTVQAKLVLEGTASSRPEASNFRIVVR